MMTRGQKEALFVVVFVVVAILAIVGMLTMEVAQGAEPGITDLGPSIQPGEIPDGDPTVVTIRGFYATPADIEQTGW